MGSLLAIGIIWAFISKSETKETRKKQRRALAVVVGGSFAWLLDGIFNADKYQDY